MMGQPLWMQIARRIADDVVRGRWQPGDHLPPRRELATIYGVALKTVNHSVSQLIADGVLAATSRVATYVPLGGPAAAARPLASSPALAQGKEQAVVLLPARSATLTGRRLLLIAPLEGGRRRPDAPSDPWTETLLAQAESAAAALGAHVFCEAVWPADVETFAQSLDEALARYRPDAVAVINLYAGDERWVDAVTHRLDWTAQPWVYVSLVEPAAAIPWLAYDQRHAGFYAARHLLDLGYARTLFLDLGEAPWAAQRLAGARDAGRAHASASPPERLPMELLQGSDRAPARRAVAAALARALANGDLAWDGSTGIIAPADEYALLVLDQIEAQGLRLGRDVGLIGFDDLPASRLRGLSTVRPPLSAFGRELVAVLAQGLDQGSTLYQRRLQPELVARASTARGQEAAA